MEHRCSVCDEAYQPWLGEWSVVSGPIFWGIRKRIRDRKQSRLINAALRCLLISMSFNLFVIRIVARLIYGE